MMMKGVDLGFKFLTKVSFIILKGCPDHQRNSEGTQDYCQEHPGVNIQPFNNWWLNSCTLIDPLYYCLFRKLYTAAIQQRLPYWPLGTIKISSPLALLSTALTHSRGVNIQRSRTVCILIGKGLDLGFKFLTKLSCTNLTGFPDH